MVEYKTGEEIPEGARMIVIKGDITTAYFDGDDGMFDRINRHKRYFKKEEIQESYRIDAREFKSNIDGIDLSFSSDVEDIQDLIAASNVPGLVKFKAKKPGDKIPTFIEFNQVQIQQALGDYYNYKNMIVEKRDQLINDIEAAQPADIEGITWI